VGSRLHRQPVARIARGSDDSDEASPGVPFVSQRREFGTCRRPTVRTHIIWSRESA